MRGQSCNYQQMYDMPCRMACNRYASPGDKFEGAFPKETYEYEPKIEREMYVPLNPMKNKKQVIKNQNQQQQQNQQSCNCSPKIYVKESYDYDPVVFNPRQNVESYTQKSGCDCGRFNPPYRMQECNYNQSPSWVTQKSGVPFNTQPDTMPTQEQPIQPIQPEMYVHFKNMDTGMNMATGMVNNSNNNGNNNNYNNNNNNNDCGCGSKNSSYRMDASCDYNQSPTWVDQLSFRDNVLNKY